MVHPRVIYYFFRIEGTVYIKKKVQDLLNSKIDFSEIDEMTWEEILSDIPPEELTDEIRSYLISNKIAIIQLSAGVSPASSAQSANRRISEG